MTPQRIKYELDIRGIRQQDIAKTASVTQACVSLIINRRGVSQRVMRAISEAIDMQPEAVFPDVFGKRAA